MPRICFALLIFAACQPTAPSNRQPYNPRTAGTTPTPTSSTPSNQTQTLPPPAVTTPPPDPTEERTVVPDPADPAPPPPADRAYGGGIGSNCATGGDTCLSPATTCLNDAGYPSGMCSAPCSRFCSDTAASKTFCINDRSGEGGICATKCAQDSDCRQGYVCQTRARYNETAIQKKVCVPASEPAKSCMDELAAMVPGGAEMAPITDGYETCNSSKVGCSVADPVQLPLSIHGVDFHDASAPGAGTMIVSCKLGQALVRFADFARTQHITDVEFSKTYSCEGAADGNSVSTHGLGEAIDFVSFTKWDTAQNKAVLYRASDYTTALVITDFFMVDFLKALQKNHVFSNIYTKECYAYPNGAHLFDDHFHVDLTNADAPIRDWFSGGHWYLDYKDLRLTQNGTSFSDQEVDVQPRACNITTAQLCEPGH